MRSDSPSIEAQRLLSGFRAYQLMVGACRLKLPDLIAGGPKSADELAAATGTHASLMHRFLRGLVTWRVFTEGPDGRFHSTPLSDTFRSDKPGLRNMTLMLSEEGYRAWSEIVYTLRTGKPAFEHVYGKSRWEKLAESPEDAAQFNAAMVETTKRVVRAFIAAYDFAGTRTVVDVGGGSGALLAAILQANPEMQGILFDVGAGLAGAPEMILSAGVDGRVKFIEGSFFDSVPSGGDVYLLKSIVHDWDEEHGVAILKNCRKAMHATSRLVLLERVMPERIDDPDAALGAVMTDLHMMVLLGGQERTPREYGELLAKAGLRMTREISLDSDFGAVEAAPD